MSKTKIGGIESECKQLEWGGYEWLEQLVINLQAIHKLVTSSWI